jgi:hypothetical protein
MTSETQWVRPSGDAFVIPLGLIQVCPSVPLYSGSSPLRSINTSIIYSISEYFKHVKSNNLNCSRPLFQLVTQCSRSAPYRRPPNCVPQPRHIYRPTNGRCYCHLFENLKVRTLVLDLVHRRHLADLIPRINILSRTTTILGFRMDKCGPLRGHWAQWRRFPVRMDHRIVPTSRLGRRTGERAMECLV